MMKMNKQYLLLLNLTMIMISDMFSGLLSHLNLEILGFNKYHLHKCTVMNDSIHILHLTCLGHVRQIKHS